MRGERRHLVEEGYLKIPRCSFGTEVDTPITYQSQDVHWDIEGEGFRKPFNCIGILSSEHNASGTERSIWTIELSQAR